jgi:hypothetical protein
LNAQLGSNTRLLKVCVLAGIVTTKMNHDLLVAGLQMRDERNHLVLQVILLLEEVAPFLVGVVINSQVPVLATTIAISFN